MWAMVTRPRWDDTGVLNRSDKCIERPQGSMRITTPVVNRVIIALLS